MPPADRIAVVDLGTNSTRLLVAEVSAGGTVTDLERRSEVTRLGDGVDASGRLDEAAMERVFAVLADYRRAMDELGAGRSVAVATSAVRDAANGAWFDAQVRERFGFDIRTIPGEEEARLTFLGATLARERDGEVLVVDIGGGSTEYVVGEPGSPPAFNVSTRLGSVRQTERHLPGDPPPADELRELREAAASIIAEEVPTEVRERVRAGVAVAGTATTLAAIDQALEPYDRDRVHGYRLTLEACEGILRRLAGVPVEERRSTAGLHPDRAPTIVAGAAILCESMIAFGLSEMEVSDADILHGAALSAASPEG